MAHQNEAKAEVSVRVSGEMYIGEEAKDLLGLGKNDRARVTVPRIGRPDVTVSGCLDSSNHFMIGKETASRIVNGFPDDTRTVRVEAIIEPAARSWEDTHGLTEKRYDNSVTLKARL